MSFKQRPIPARLAGKRAARKVIVMHSPPALKQAGGAVKTITADTLFQTLSAYQQG